MRKLKLYLLSLLLFGAIGLALLAATELLVRWSVLSGSEERRDHTESTDFLPTRLKANYSGQFWGVPFQTNQYGFRDEPDFPRSPGESEYRVLSLGDSIAFGLGVPAAAHYTRVACRELRGRRPALELRVINAGGQGYSPSGYLVYLAHEGLDLNPDLVLVEFELCNDVSDEALLNWSGAGEAGSPEKVVGGRYLVAWDGNLLGTYSLAGYPWERTYLYTDLVRRILQLKARWGGEGKSGDSIYYSLGFDRGLLTESRLETGWQRLFQAVSATSSLLEDRGVNVLFMIMPSRFIYQEIPGYTTVASAAVTRAREWLDTHGLAYLDLTEAVGEGGGAALFFDFAHLTEEGNAVVGRYLAGQLQAFIPPSRPESLPTGPAGDSQ